MEILKKTGKFLLGVVIGVAIMMFADRYYVKGKRLIADNLPKEPVEYVNPYTDNFQGFMYNISPSPIYRFGTSGRHSRTISRSSI